MNDCTTTTTTADNDEVRTTDFCHSTMTDAGQEMLKVLRQKTERDLLQEPMKIICTLLYHGVVPTLFVA